jgi:hypothetical protein
MIIVTPDLKKKMDEYFDRFGDIVPLEMLPGSETNEGLIRNINKSLEADKDLLPELYGWKTDGTEIY